MKKSLIDEIESIFRVSDSSDKLFDYFKIAVENRIEEINLYKVFLANPVFCTEEIFFYCDKIAAEFPKLKYDIYLWSAGILENAHYCAVSLEKALEYYQKAIESKPTQPAPLLSMMNMYNAELDFPPSSTIISLVEKYSDGIEHKKELFFALSAFCKKTKKRDLAKQYEAQAYYEQKKEGNKKG